MRFLHTGDWHLGRTIRGRSRIDESARVLDDVVRIAVDEGVDAVLVAGDTFDSFSPPTDAQKLLYETLTRLISARIKVVMIAGNHDSAPRMDAVASLLELTGVHFVGTPPRDDYAPVRITGRDGDEAVIAAVPWIPERLSIDYDALFGPADNALGQYAANMQRALDFYCRPFSAKTVNLLLGHMFVSGATVREGGGERKLQTGDLFAVLGSTLPQAAQYIALGHVHKPQPVPGSPVSGASFYAGSLLQLDFGEAEQPKSVRVIDVKPGLPADPREVFVTSGTGLRDVRCTLETLQQHAGQYGAEYLRVYVEVAGVVPSLGEQVREVLPNAIDVVAVRTDVPAAPSDAPRLGMEPHELVARYYRETHSDEIPKPLIALFNRMYEEELHASA